MKETKERQRPFLFLIPFLAETMLSWFMRVKFKIRSNFTVSIYGSTKSPFHIHEILRTDREIYNMHYDVFAKEYLQ